MNSFEYVLNKPISELNDTFSVEPEEITELRKMLFTDQLYIPTRTVTGKFFAGYKPKYDFRKETP